MLNIKMFHVLVKENMKEAKEMI